MGNLGKIRLCRRAVFMLEISEGTKLWWTFSAHSINIHTCTRRKCFVISSGPETSVLDMAKPMLQHTLILSFLHIQVKVLGNPLSILILSEHS